jgi:hypothetical protein
MSNSSENEKKIKHLEFLQLTITRMNVNSFLIKGWTITLVAALFALASKDANINYIMICYIAIPSFWVLDGFYISIERQYRELYKEVSDKKEDDIDFKMDASKFKKEDKTWISGMLSKTLVIFYGVCVATTIIVMFLIKK